MNKTFVSNIFVSHSHKDNDFGIRLVNDLRLKLGDNTRVWYDAAGGLNGGDEWWSKILRELAICSVFIVILSPESMASKWVNDEITIAWAHRNSAEGKMIIPLIIRNCEIRDDLKILHTISFQPPKTYEMALEELVKILQTFAPGVVTKPVQYKKSTRTKLEKSARKPQRAKRKVLSYPPNMRRVRQLVRKNIIGSKMSVSQSSLDGDAESLRTLRQTKEGVSESLRTLHQRNALYSEYKEAKDNESIEFLPTPFSKKNGPNRPIILGTNSDSKSID